MAVQQRPLTVLLLSPSTGEPLDLSSTPKGASRISGGANGGLRGRTGGACFFVIGCCDPSTGVPMGCVHVGTGLPRGLLSLLLFTIFSFALPAALAQTTTTTAASLKEVEGDRLSHFHSYRVEENIGSIDAQSSAQWMELNAHLPLLKLSLPATHMSTLTDVNNANYTEAVKAQEVGVASQLKDGIRLLDVRMWRGRTEQGELPSWFTEVPWRLSADAEVLREMRDVSDEALSASGIKALEVHSRSDLTESLFNPVLQFLRKSMSEVVVVVISAVNGNVHTNHNEIVSGSELADSLAHAQKEWQAFSRGPGSPTITKDGVKTEDDKKPPAFRLSPAPASVSPLFESFVRKRVTFEHFQEITDLIDNFWGQLLPSNQEKFVDSKKQLRRLSESVQDPNAFREWQRHEGRELLKKSISELRQDNVRLILLVDDPLLAWFITTKSTSQVLALVKADHLYDLSFKSESRFIPCASPHTTIAGEPVKSRIDSWVNCRGFCVSVGLEECSSWVWTPNAKEQGSSAVVASRAPSDLGSIWEEKADDELGKCQLFKSGRAELSFEATSQQATCPFADLRSTDGPWNPRAVTSDFVRSMLPLVLGERRRFGRRQAELILSFNPQLSLLSTGSNTEHQMKYDISEKLLRIVFAPPTPRIQVGLEATQGALHGGTSDVVGRFNAMLADLLLVIISLSHALGKEGRMVRPVNAIQIYHYNRIHSSKLVFATSNFFEHVMVLNPSGAVDAKLLAFPASFGFSLTDPTTEEDLRGFLLSPDTPNTTKMCHRRAVATGGPPIATVEVVGIPGNAMSRASAAT
ncbi:hypothetical protein ACSSS7_002263 [Eimeria intestinalis]